MESDHQKADKLGRARKITLTKKGAEHFKVHVKCILKEKKLYEV